MIPIFAPIKASYRESICPHIFYEKIHQKVLEIDALETKRKEMSFLPILNLDNKRETERTQSALFERRCVIYFKNKEFCLFIKVMMKPPFVN